MSLKRAWCPRCASPLGQWRQTQLVAAVDGKAHATVTGHSVEVWSADGRVLERVAGEPGLPLWDPVAGDDESRSDL